jgi:protein-glutamine gamma-glutamyltransferase
MKLDTAFRLSFYLTLGMACACLAQAEAYFLLWFPFVCLPAVGVVFALAWRYEGRWIVTETASNYLGIFIGLATGAWILMQLPRSDEDLVAGGVPWPAGLLPHLGPLLLILLAVKLFRPKKLADFWIVQTIGLMLVTLGCVLAGDPLFAGLLIGYLTCLLWCLALFHVYRARRPAGMLALFTAADVVVGSRSEPTTLGDVPWRFLGVGKVLRWSAAILLVGLPLFVLLPRSGSSQWVPQKLSSGGAIILSVGIDSGINVNRVGTVELSPDPAFQVRATDAAGAAVAVSPNMLWRAEVLDYYQNGRWITWSQAQPFLRLGMAKVQPPVGSNMPAGMMPLLPPLDGPSATLGGAQPIVPSVPAGPADDQRHLHFTVQPIKAGGLVLAEPVDVRHVGLDAWVGDARPHLDLFHAVPGGDSVLAFLPSRRATYRYTQILVPSDAQERVPARSYQPSYREHIVAQPVPAEVGTWARALLGRLPALSPARRSLDDEGRLPADHHAAVSQAFSRHLALAGEYTYSLNLKRHDATIDPTADFLINVKVGHCERYAAALALALRSLEIPTRIVRGYRGATEDGEGQYVVRLDQAHSWVQALIHEDGQWYWLTLDPTPGQEAAANPLVNWLDWLIGLEAEEVWRRFLLNYNAEVQHNALYYLWQGVWQSPTARHLLWQTPAGLAALVVLLGAWRRRAKLLSVLRLPARGTAGFAAPPEFYGRLLRLLGQRLALRPEPGQTPLEFAAVVAAALRQAPGTAAWAALPGQAVQALYQVRFAGRELTAAEQAALQREIMGLDAALGRNEKED